MASPVRIKKRCRPLRRESDDRPWFVTTRVIEERFWLHPILSCGAKPLNREARRSCAHLEASARRARSWDVGFPEGTYRPALMQAA